MEHIWWTPCTSDLSNENIPSDSQNYIKRKKKKVKKSYLNNWISLDLFTRVLTSFHIWQQLHKKHLWVYPRDAGVASQELYPPSLNAPRMNFFICSWMMCAAADTGAELGTPWCQTSNSRNNHNNNNSSSSFPQEGSHSTRRHKKPREHPKLWRQAQQGGNAGINKSPTPPLQLCAAPAGLISHGAVDLDARRCLQRAHLNRGKCDRLV